jgi:branched-chain amino acid transport system substrate-binding protein
MLQSYRETPKSVSFPAALNLLPQTDTMKFSSARIRRTASVAALIFATVASTSCDNDSSGPTETEEILIGGLFSLTGSWSSLGVTSKAAMEIGIEDVNQYLADGGSGMRFTAAIRDTKLDPAMALTHVTELKSAGAEVVIGPQSSAEVAAIKSYVDANGILVASPSSTAGTLAIAGDNIFRFTPSDTLEAVALVGLMKADGMTTIIPFWRNDAGNVGLQVATRALFAQVGSVKAGVQYPATQPDFAAALASLKTQVQAAITERGGTAGIAVAHAGFDEVVDVFKLATTDQVLSSVRWYGTDGTALTEPLRSDPVAAAFARKVSFWAPIPGVDAAASARWQPVAARIAAKAGSPPDAFGLAVYDAVWVAAQAYLAAGGKGRATALRKAFVTSAEGFYGASGWTALNAAGDRRFGDFDFFSLSQAGAGFAWSLRAHYNTQSGVLTRYP